jgi:crotonobetainyl-CoA:carnitine CoA-transferase CaiB-like acyl-CoA transferase
LTAALSDIKSVEFGGYAAGPGIPKYLVNHGATAIRVESGTRPDGFRTHYPPFKGNRPGLNRSGCFAMYNDDKLSVTLNLKTPAGIELAKRLVAWADVVVENFTPGTMKRLGLDYESLRAINPDLIMLSTCNHGQTGPHAHHPGFGSQLSSLAGFTHFTGEPDGPPLILYGPYIDFVAVAFGFVAVLAALDRRRRTGEGCYIDLSQHETGLQFLAPAILDARVNGHVQSRQGNRAPAAAPHGAYPCRGEDRWCTLSAGSDREWERLVEVMGDPAWAKEPRFSTLTGRKAHEGELDRRLGEWTRQFAPDELMALLQRAGIRAGAVNGIPDLLADPQLRHRGLWWPLSHAEMGDHHAKAPPFLLSRTPARPGRPSPCLGEHNEMVLKGILGLSDDEFDRLQSQGVIA